MPQACLALFLVPALQACSEPERAPAASSTSKAEPGTRQDGQPGGDAEKGFEPGQSLAFEWSANGFEQLESKYQWSGSSVQNADFQPHLSLSVPETDDTVWSSGCESGGKVRTVIYFPPPGDIASDTARFKFETDRSTATLEYVAKYAPGGQFDGFVFTQDANDPMFSEMKAGTWAYVQIGEGAGAAKFRISLANAGRALNTFLPACAAR